MTPSFTILLTSAGRRTSLLKACLAAAHAAHGRVLAGDADPLAPALYLADEGYRFPPLAAEEYLPFLRDFVRDHGVRLIIPTIDTELPVLAAAALELAAAGCCALVSSPSFVSITGDKWKTVCTFAHHGIAVPRSWLPADLGNAEDPPAELFVKPRAGSASQHTYRTTLRDAARVLPSVPDAIVQEHISSPEITIDALLDFEGRPLHCVPRLRIRSLAGESIQGVTIDDNAGLREWLVRVLDLCASLGARGPLTLQAFLTDAGPVLSEINPRFGGGFPLTYAAGGRYPDWIVAMLLGETITPSFGEYKRGLYMTRYYVEHFMEKPLWNR